MWLLRGGALQVKGRAISKTLDQKKIHEMYGGIWFDWSGGNPREGKRDNGVVIL